MIKNYFFKIILLVLFCNIFTNASAQYAVGGTAGPTLVNSVYWLTWDKSATGSTLVTVPAGADKDHIINGTYIWQSSPTVRITAILSNEVFTDGDKMIAYTPGNYSGDGLDLIYSGNNLPKPDSRGVPNSGLATTDRETISFDIDVKVSILINSVWTDVDYPGMIIADAESLDANVEYISGTTPNSIAWQLLNKRSVGNANDSHYKLELSNSSRSFKLYADQPPGNFGVQAVLFAKGARNLTNVTMRGEGLTAMAIGFIFPFDYGDAPSTYGSPGSYIDSFQATDSFSSDGTYSVINYNTTTLTPQATVYIGANNVDANGQPGYSANADGDDDTGSDDENTIIPANLADIRVNQTGNIVFTFPVTNTKNVPANLYGWLDFNNDGVFAANELATIVVPAHTNNQNVTLTFPSAAFNNIIKAGPLYARFRITTSALLDDASTTVDERSTASSADGEIEDYRLKDILGSGISISGNVFHDANGATDGAISGNGVQSVSGKQLYAYLTDNTATIINKSVVSTTGSYVFGDVVNGSYKVAISTNDVAIGGTLAAVAANLPFEWVPSGEDYGTNNAGRYGIEPGTPNLQIDVTLPGQGLSVTGVNFGLDQRPVTVADAGSANIGRPVIIDVAANDSDPDGTVDITKVLLTDPSDNGEKNVVTVANEGNYRVDGTTGKVTFNPLIDFVGKVTPLAYTIKDNFGAESGPSLIAITIKPMGMPDSTSTPVNTPVTTNVKSNDGPSGVRTTVIPTNGGHGTTTMDASGNVVYTPNLAFAGADNFTYTLNTVDNVASDPVMVKITVIPNIVPVTPVTSLSLTKAANNTGTKAGDVINYTLVVTNTGNVTVSNLQVTDPRVDNGSIAPATIASLKAGASATVTAKHTLTQDDVNKRRFANQAAVAGTDSLGNVVSQPKSDDPTTPAVNDSTVVIITPASAISITKTGVFANNTITYSFVITNTGNLTLNNITLTDTKLGLAGIPIATPAGGLLPGASVNYSSTYIVTQADKTTGSVTNTATTSGKDPSGGTVTGSATITTPVSKGPVAVDDVAQTNADQPVIIEVLKNDDPGSSTFDLQSLEIVSQPQYGMVKINSTGTVTYTPNTGYVGLDSFKYRIKDAFGYYTNVANVTITINFTGIVKIPNIFTPNGDGVNDVFEIRRLDQYALNKISIVNRWGNEVFREDNYKNTWRGDGLNEGTYYYVLQVKKTLQDDWQVYKGYVMLLRTFGR